MLANMAGLIKHFPPGRPIPSVVSSRLLGLPHRKLAVNLHSTGKKLLEQITEKMIADIFKSGYNDPKVFRKPCL